ncbi:MAG: hypothetical protein OIF35_03425, partial [Cellvibrionaceae bacterium]|nr:hypothetical protein [Cellvibrionaceae bacterium]
MLARWMYKFSWRAKILLLVALPLSLLLLISLLSAYTIRQQNHAVAEVLAAYQGRQEISSATA